MTLNKKGGYLVEASVILPLFFISMLVLISIVSMFAAAENAVFSMCDQHMMADMEAAFVKDGATLPALTIVRLKDENPGFGTVVPIDYSYLHSDGDMDDLISLSVYAAYKVPLFSPKIIEGVRSRAFTGSYKSGVGASLDEDDESDIVYVFPMYGERYHNRECGFLNPACQQVFLTDKVKNKFAPCEICGSEKAEIGTSVYCFNASGRVYHMGSCHMVDRYFVEIERKDAEGKGYLPCASCGG